MGVGNISSDCVDPHPFSEMGGAQGFCSEHTPASMIPHAGKVLQDSDKTTGSEEGTVFDEDFLRLDFTDDTSEISPKP